MRALTEDDARVHDDGRITLEVPLSELERAAAALLDAGDVILGTQFTLWAAKARLELRRRGRLTVSAAAAELGCTIDTLMSSGWVDEFGLVNRADIEAARARAG
jgi:hypothetical protein